MRDRAQPFFDRAHAGSIPDACTLAIGLSTAAISNTISNERAHDVVLRHRFALASSRLLKHRRRCFRQVVACGMSSLRSWLGCWTEST